MSKENLQAVHAHIDSMATQDIALLERLVRIPSVASQENDKGVRDCANVLKEILMDMGFTAEIYETETQPFVFGERKSKSNPGGKTILFYGHYDVQPAEPLEQWNTPPFEPTIIDGRMYGRGTADNKGQFLPHLLAVRSYLAVTDDIPVNIKFLFDGEEENGSPSFEQFANTHKELLACDLSYVADGPMLPTGSPEIKHGVRGLLTFEIEVRTGEHANHSGRSGGTIKNAIIELAHLISSMIDESANITVPGVYDDVVPATEYEKQLIASIPFSAEKQAKIFGVSKLVKEDQQEFYKQVMFSPTFTVSGIQGGYNGKGVKASVPEYAMCKVDMRLVAKMDPDDVAQKIEKHVAARCPEATVTFKSKIRAGKSDPGAPECCAMLDAARKYYPKVVAVPSTGGSGPGFVFTDIIGKPYGMIAYGNADQQNHAANENLSLECFHRGTHCSAELIQNIAQIQASEEGK